MLKLEGEVSLPQIGELMQQAVNDPDYSPTLNVLADARGFTSVYSYDVLHGLARKMPDAGEKAGQTKAATLVNEDVTFGMGRVWEVIAEYKNLRSESRVFRKIEEALEWLGLPVDTEIEVPF